MGKAPKLEDQLDNLTRQLRQIADRILSGMDVIGMHFQESSQERLAQLVVWGKELEILSKKDDSRRICCGNTSNLNNLAATGAFEPH